MKNFIKIMFLMCALTFVVPQTTYAAIEIIENEEQITVTVSDTRIHVTGAYGYTMYIYNVTGGVEKVVRIDGNDKYINVELKRGCYLVKVGNVVRKFYVN